MKKGDFVNGKGEFDGYIIEESKQAYYLKAIWNRVDIWITKSWIKGQGDANRNQIGNKVIRFTLHKWAIPKFSVKMQDKIDKIHVKKYWKSNPDTTGNIENQKNGKIKEIEDTNSLTNCDICHEEFNYSVGSELENCCSISCYKEFRKISQDN